MVFELLVRPHEAEAHPWKVFVLSSVLSIIAYVISIKLFPSSYSTASVLMAAMFLTPIVTGIFISEEKEEERGKSDIPKIINVMWMIFLGAMVSFFAIYLLPLPAPASQAKEIARISGSALLPGQIGEIISNNMTVLLITYLMSFLFGATAILIVIWNASIVGTWAGKIFERAVSQQGIGQAIVAAGQGLLSISLHGSLEFTAYFLAAIGGGIISVSLLRKRLHKGLETSVMLFGVSVLLIVVAGIIEGLI